MVPKSDQLPPQSVISNLRLRVGICMRTEYGYNERREISIRLYTEAWKLLREGRTLDEFEKLRPMLTYEVHKKWHEEMYVLHHRQSDIVFTPV